MDHAIEIEDVFRSLMKCRYVRDPIADHGDECHSNCDNFPSVVQVLKIGVEPLGQESETLLNH